MGRKGDKRRFLKAFKRLFRRAKYVHLQIERRDYSRARSMLEGVAKDRDYRPRHKREEAIRLLCLLGKITHRRYLHAPYLDSPVLPTRRYPIKLETTGTVQHQRRAS